MRVKWTIRILGGVVVLAVLLVGGTAARVWQVARTDNRTKVDSIIVLGSTQANGIPMPILQSRLNHAEELYDSGVARHVITVGGKQPGDEFTEAQAGQRYLRKAGLPQDAVIAVNTGRDTLNSMKAAAQELRTRGWRSAVLVSDPWHCFRAQVMARDSGIDATVSPTHSGPIVEDRTTEFRYIARETAGLLFYRLTKSSTEKPTFE